MRVSRGHHLAGEFNVGRLKGELTLDSRDGAELVSRLCEQHLFLLGLGLVALLMLQLRLESKLT